MLNCNIEKKLNHFVLNVDFTVENEILCIMGESGSGKTSILNSIAGILTPDKGDILSLIHISEPTRLRQLSRMPSSA